MHLPDLNFTTIQFVNVIGYILVYCHPCRGYEIESAIQSQDSQHPKWRRWPVRSHHKEGVIGTEGSRERQPKFATRIVIRKDTANEGAQHTPLNACTMYLNPNPGKIFRDVKFTHTARSLLLLLP